ncbi:hypothetical protein H072_169 [Dactylellina haptotyla CBS 200.50]|uniref:Uncharacterized protein n=1 Tax=Dactylellina haptotyla (strain CBS 200.50) TaxID=1284197 RepID=S8AS03_DACHA|nr:hypothetical protein H072_169 [Dactylellina haptotyla CBS 200.50]
MAHREILTPSSTGSFMRSADSKSSQFNSPRYARLYDSDDDTVFLGRGGGYTQDIVLGPRYRSRDFSSSLSSAHQTPGFEHGQNLDWYVSAHDLALAEEQCDWDRAIEILVRIINSAEYLPASQALAQSFLEYDRRLAALYYNGGYWGKVITTFERAEVEEMPFEQQINAYNMWAVAYLQLGYFAEAANISRDALRLAEKQPTCEDSDETPENPTELLDSFIVYATARYLKRDIKRASDYKRAVRPSRYTYARGSVVLPSALFRSFIRINGNGRNTLPFGDGDINSISKVLFYLWSFLHSPLKPRNPGTYEIELKRGGRSRITQRSVSLNYFGVAAFLLLAIIFVRLLA